MSGRLASTWPALMNDGPSTVNVCLPMVLVLIALPSFALMIKFDEFH